MSRGFDSNFVRFLIASIKITTQSPAEAGLGEGESGLVRAVAVGDGDDGLRRTEPLVRSECVGCAKLSTALVALERDGGKLKRWFFHAPFS